MDFSLLVDMGAVKCGAAPSLLVAVRIMDRELCTVTVTNYSSRLGDGTRLLNRSATRHLL